MKFHLLSCHVFVWPEVKCRLTDFFQNWKPSTSISNMETTHLSRMTRSRTLGIFNRTTIRTIFEVNPVDSLRELLVRTGHFLRLSVTTDRPLEQGSDIHSLERTLLWEKGALNHERISQCPALLTNFLLRLYLVCHPARHAPSEVR